MTTPQERASGGIAGKGLLLTLLAVVVGTFLLARTFEGSSDSLNVASEPSGDTDNSQESEGSLPTIDPNNSDTSDDGSTSSDNGTLTTIPSDTSQPILDTRPPSEVKVATVNGTGKQGLAGRVAEILKSRNYVTLAKNATGTVEESTIFYRAEYADDAKGVAKELGAPADSLNPAPSNILSLISNPQDVNEFHIYVMLGTDDVLPVE